MPRTRVPGPYFIVVDYNANINSVVGYLTFSDALQQINPAFTVNANTNTVAFTPLGTSSGFTQSLNPAGNIVVSGLNGELIVSSTQIDFFNTQNGELLTSTVSGGSLNTVTTNNVAAPTGAPTAGSIAPTDQPTAAAAAPSQAPTPGSIAPTASSRAPSPGSIAPTDQPTAAAAAPSQAPSPGSRAPTASSRAPSPGSIAPSPGSRAPTGPGETFPPSTSRPTNAPFPAVTSRPTNAPFPAVTGSPFPAVTRQPSSIAPFPGLTGAPTPGQANGGGASGGGSDIAGIAAGIAVGVALLGGLVSALWYYRRNIKRRQQGQANLNPNPLDGLEVGQMYAGPAAANNPAFAGPGIPTDPVYNAAAEARARAHASPPISPARGGPTVPPGLRNRGASAGSYLDVDGAYAQPVDAIGGAAAAAPATYDEPEGEESTYKKFQRNIPEDLRKRFNDFLAKNDSFKDRIAQLKRENPLYEEIDEEKIYSDLDPVNLNTLYQLFLSENGIAASGPAPDTEYAAVGNDGRGLPGAAAAAEPVYEVKAPSPIYEARKAAAAAAAADADPFGVPMVFNEGVYNADAAAAAESDYATPETKDRFGVPMVFNEGEYGTADAADVDPDKLEPNPDYETVPGAAEAAPVVPRRAPPPPPRGEGGGYSNPTDLSWPSSRPASPTGSTASRDPRESSL